MSTIDMPTKIAQRNPERLPWILPDGNNPLQARWFRSGIQTMLAVERGSGYRVAVNCSGAAESLRGSSSLQARLIAASALATSTSLRGGTISVILSRISSERRCGGRRLRRPAIALT